MPRLCSFGCPPSDVPMHRFPNREKFPDRFKTWVELVGGKLDSPSDYEYYQKKRVCDLHFSEKDRNRYNRLNALAVPSRHFGDALQEQNLSNQPGVSEPTTTNQPKSDALQEQNMANQPDCSSSVGEPTTRNQPTSESPQAQSISKKQADCSISASSTSKQPNSGVLDEHNYAVLSRKKRHVPRKDSRPKFNCSQIILRTKIKHLRSEVCRLRKKSKTFKAKIENANKLLDDSKFTHVVQNMSKPAQLFVHMQLQKSKSPKGRRFSIEEKILTLSLYKKSPKCYPLLQKYFTLPSVKAMKRLLGQIKLFPGINPIIFEKIKKTVMEKDITDRLCSLSFDEMSLSAQIQYNSQKDSLEGFATNNESRFADHALVFMVKGVKQNFKQPIAYYFTSRLNKFELKQLITTVITHAQAAGLVVLNTVCDQSTVNTGAITSLVEDAKASYLKKGKEWRHNVFFVNGRKIIPLFDTPHLIKGIRNNLLTKDMRYCTQNEEKTVKWEYYQKVYEADKSLGELRLLHKITEEHVNPEKINKMKVKSATQIFSHSVAVVTEHLTARGELPEECRHLIDITLLLDNLFDSLNVSTLNIPNGKIYKGPIKNNSPHHELWRESKKILKTVKFIKKEKKDNKIRIIETTAVPSVVNLIKTIEGMEALWEVISKKYGYDALLTRNFNQDPVENFFGNIRSYGVRNISPNTVAFEGAFKALLLNNYSAPHSQRANCEDDGNECLQNLDFFLKERCLSRSDVPNPDNAVHYDENLYLNMNNTEVDAGQRNYVCGWILTKCLKTICKSCQHCRATLLDKDNKNNEYIKAKEYNNKHWLCYPSQALEICFQDLQRITKSFLNNNVPKKKLRYSILECSNILIEYPFDCTTHKEQLEIFFATQTVQIIIYSWCRSVNRILSGKIKYEGEDKTKTAAAEYYNKHKNYKNKK